MARTLHDGLHFNTWIDVLQQHSSNKPTSLAYTFIEGQQERESLTFSRLDHRARAVAAKLQSVAAVGDRALLLYPPGLEYIVAFMGCIYAGVIPVPAYPPHSSQLKRHLPRLQSIAADARPRIILSNSAQLEHCEAAFPKHTGAAPTHLLASDTIPEECASGWVKPALTLDSLALLQVPPPVQRPFQKVL